jgi:hypothetical protein
MNLKLVVASMSVLGLVSCPVLAAKHKHKTKHHAMTASAPDYKDMGSLPVAPAKDSICTIPQSTVMMTEMSQNVGRALPNPCMPDWFKRISLSGGVNVDLGKFGNRNTNYMGENYQRFSLNDIYMNLSADVNDWTHAFASLSYNTATINQNPSQFNTQFGNAEYDAAYSNNVNGGANAAVQVEQAYATFANFDSSPFFLQVGKSFQDFSRYEIHPITESLTQVMSETLATSLKGGFLYNGFTGSLYGFDDPIRKIGNSQNSTNYGVSLGYDQNGSDFGWDVGAGYLYNIIGANGVAYNVVNFTGTNVYNSRVGAVALYGDLNSGPFTFAARYTSAVQRFNVNDLTENGFADLAAGSAAIGSGTAITPAASASGAKPWAAGVQAGYNFDAWGKNQNIYLGYQASREAAGLNLPKSRWLAGYDVAMFGENTSLGIEWDHDMAYSAGDGGTNNNTNLVSVRSSVKFG